MLAVHQYIDHTILKPTCLVADIQKLCDEAKQYQFAAVCVPPNFVKLAKELVNGTAVQVATVIGFPFGYSATEAKIAEIILAMVDGADELDGAPVAVKEAVLPFGRFAGVDSVLGPEMKSTGEVMGIDASFGMAYAKSQSGAYAGGLPLSGSVFVSAADKDKNQMSSAIKKLDELGFEIFATKGTAEFIAKQGIKSKILRKVQEGSIDGETTSTEAIMKGDIDLVVNTPHGGGTRTDGFEIRSAATKKSVPIITTAQGLKAAVAGIEALQKTGFTVKSLQEWAKDLEVARQKFYREVGN